MKNIPNGCVKAMRELLTQARYINDYHALERAFFDEISTRNLMKSLEMDALVFMQLVIIERFRNQKTRCQPCQNDIEHVTVQIRSGCASYSCHRS